MYYFLIVIASVLFSLQFVFNSGYEKECKSSWQSALNFSLYTAIAGFLGMFAINGFKMNFSFFSLAVALVYSIASILYSYSSIKSFESINLSMYSMFAMLGGMLLPFLVGIGFYNEEITPIRIVGCVLIAVALIAQVQKSEKKNGATKFYFFVFILNGMFGVLSKFHQTNGELSIDSTSFLMLASLWTIVFCVLLKGKPQKHLYHVNRKALVYCVGYALFNSVGNLLLLIALQHLPASVQYPIVTGGVIVISTLIALARKEHVTIREGGGATVALLATILIAL